MEINQSEEKKYSEGEKSSIIDETEIAEAPAYYHESEDLFAKDIAQQMAVLLDMSATTEELRLMTSRSATPTSLSPQINKNSDR